MAANQKRRFFAGPNYVPNWADGTNYKNQRGNLVPDQSFQQHLPDIKRIKNFRDDQLISQYKYTLKRERLESYKVSKQQDNSYDKRLPLITLDLKKKIFSPKSYP